MDPRRWETIKAAFDDLIELDETRRAGRLAVLGRMDPDLRAAVESLLAADAEAEGWLAPLKAALLGASSPGPDTLGLAGRTVSHFRVLQPLGAGGMGVVYRALDTRLGRPVALKFLLPPLGLDAGAKARFLREAHSAAALDHPNLCTIHEVGVGDDGRLFLAMPLYPGETLKARLARDGPFALGKALEIARQIAEGLACAHAAGIVHRDLKPGNVMLLPDGTVKVLDFGLAKARDESNSASDERAGTVAYMAPEQIRGEVVDGRTDLWALGVVLYEMVTGRKPPTQPTSVRQAQPPLPKAVERPIRRALATKPGDRYGTAAEFALALKRAHSRITVPVRERHPGWRQLLRSGPGLTLAALLLGALVGGVALFAHASRVRWASAEALPEIQRLLDHREFVNAYRLARRAAPYLTNNAEFQRLWHAVTFPVSIRTTPPDARIYIGDYRARGDWDLLGTSPTEEIRIPAGLVRFHVEKAGFHTLDAALSEYDGPVIQFELESDNERPEMIRVPGGSFEYPSMSSVQLAAFWLDRYEVTNREFKEFVERGGYRERKFWTHPVIADKRQVPWEQAVAAFADRTGRPGPSTWELSRYPEGRDDYPVGGVSWYEAAAYCAYAGKQLPTFHHWYKAARLQGFSSILALSNLSGQAPAPVGAYGGIGEYGHYDMAGNVREWVLNPFGGLRYILGGAWNDPAYMFSLPYAISPLDRSPKNGVRCAIYPSESAETLGAELLYRGREYERKPVADDAFRLYRDLYAYERTPLNAKLESVDDTPLHWRHETVTFDAPYSEERITVHLFLPKVGNPPYQAVVYYPGLSAFYSESSRDIDAKWFDFIVRTGRAVVHPVYEGTYERRASRALERERVIHWTMDIGRSIDYLETRGDIDANRLAFYGFSYGAWNGPIFTAIETRFRASVLLAGGLVWFDRAPEIEPVNFAPRATVPVLMVNGRDDFYFPLKDAQLPLLRLLGASDQDKRHALVQGGHNPDDWQSVVKEVLDWLDRYLGLVR